LTDNFDACRDLNGRRLRHANADKRLAEWAAAAKERELEKIAAKQIREEEKQALREALNQVRSSVDDFTTLVALYLKLYVDFNVFGGW